MAGRDEKSKRENRIRRFIRETTGELRKVSWPTRQEALNLTLVVLAVTATMSLFLGALDFLFTRLFRFVISL